MIEPLEQLRKDRQRAEYQERAAWLKWRNCEQHFKKLKDAAWVEWEKAAAKDIKVTEAFEREKLRQDVETFA